MNVRQNIPQSPITKDYIATFLPSNPIIIEAGAHIGRDTLKMSRLWPECKIYAFEPVPELYAQLKERTKEQANVQCFELALSDANGTAVFQVSSGASTAVSSLLEPSEYRINRPDVFFTPLTITTVTLDAWAEQHRVAAVDFLWLDMQGYELHVLDAAPRIRQTVKAMLIEASLTERFKNNPLYDEVLARIEAWGFTAVRQDIPKHNKINILFVR